MSEVVPSVFQKLCIISCVSKSFCSPLHGTVEAQKGDFEMVEKVGERGHVQIDIISRSKLDYLYNTLPPIIMEVENGSLQY